MGGAAQHMKHIWEARKLTFKNLHDLINDLLDASILNISEKLDGQNLMVTWIDDEIKAARNKGHLKNFGETSLNIEEMKEFFKDRGELYTAFVTAIEDLQNSFLRSKLNLDKIFKNGKNWLNIEIIYHPTQNIIPYYLDRISMHHFRRVDIEGNVIKVHEKKLNKLATNLKTSKNKIFNIIDLTGEISIEFITDVNIFKTDYGNALNIFQNEYGIDDENTIYDFIENEIRQHITNFFHQLKIFNYKKNILLKEQFINRWAYGIKNPSITTILKNVKNRQVIEWFKSEDKIIDKLIKKLTFPLEILFMRLGGIILNNLFGTLGDQETIQEIKFKLTNTLSTLKELSEENTEIKDFLKIQTNKFDKAGGFDNIAPTEGIVFEYKGELLKLTGNFGPINQLIGYLKFKR